MARESSCGKAGKIGGTSQLQISGWLLFVEIERPVSCREVSMVRQERLLSVQELMKDYFRGGKLTDNPRFCLDVVSGKEKSVWG